MVIAAWAVFNAAVRAVATSLGYEIVSGTAEPSRTKTAGLAANGVTLETERSDVVHGKLLVCVSGTC